MVTYLTYRVAHAICSGERFHLDKFIEHGKPEEYLPFAHYNFFYSYPEWEKKWSDGKICEFHRVDIACHCCRKRVSRNYAGVGTVYLTKATPGWGNGRAELIVFCNSCKNWRNSIKFDPKQTIEYPWSQVWDWMPSVGGMAQMHAVILPNYGYCYGDQVRITSMKGSDVVCVVENKLDPTFWKNGTTYHCKLSDLWPPIYEEDNPFEETEPKASPKQAIQLQLSL